MDMSSPSSPSTKELQEELLKEYMKDVNSLGRALRAHGASLVRRDEEGHLAVQPEQRAYVARYALVQALRKSLRAMEVAIVSQRGGDGQEIKPVRTTLQDSAAFKDTG